MISGRGGGEPNANHQSAVAGLKTLPDTLCILFVLPYIFLLFSLTFIQLNQSIPPASVFPQMSPHLTPPWWASEELADLWWPLSAAPAAASVSVWVHMHRCLFSPRIRFCLTSAENTDILFLNLSNWQQHKSLESWSITAKKICFKEMWTKITLLLPHCLWVLLPKAA